ncbi:MAG: catalase/peroxidase HPI [Nitriliruptoraceae bacterium]
MADNISQCPFSGTRTSTSGPSVDKWWPEQLNLRILYQNPAAASPLGDDFNYAEAFATIDLDELARDVDAIMTDSKDWWPADYGHYGPLFIRMAWHSAGTYRVADGRGGGGSAAQRFAPLNSWPDNANLDKARRLLWPVKQKYGKALSWADLMIFAGNRALETMGLKTFGFGGGREDIWAPEEDVYWGPESVWLAAERYAGERELQGPLGAVQMGLIYVNPEGPNGVPDPLAAAHDIRDTFERMAMNDEETVALIAGGHTFGKTHGAAPDTYVGREPEGAGITEMGLGWKNSYGSGVGADTYTSGLEGAWTSNPIQWDNGYFELLFKYEWELTESPAGAKQWTPVDVQDVDLVPDAHDPSKKHAPFMATTDLTMIKDPAYLEISRRFYENPDQLADAFSRAWFKLTHRDMGPIERYIGSQVPSEVLTWQDPVPVRDYDLIDASQIAALKKAILHSGVAIPQLISTAWASAVTYRNTDKRGGPNGAHIRLEPQKSWDMNQRAGVADVIAALEAIQQNFNDTEQTKARVSVADLIVLAGCAAIEAAAQSVGIDLTVPFTPGRTDATQELTDVDSFGYLEPVADGFRNYTKNDVGPLPAEHLLLDRAFLLNLSAPEMAALVGGMRVLGVTVDGSSHGVLTDRPGVLSNDFFVNILDQRISWTATDDSETTFEGRESGSVSPRWTGTRADLIFGSNSQLRAISEEFACIGATPLFAEIFVSAWAKVMELDRFDLR